MVIIRPAAIEDAEAIAKVHVAAWLTTYRGGLMPTDVLERQFVASRLTWWEATLREPHADDAIVAEEQREIVLCFICPERENDPVYGGELYAIYVLHEHQRKGIERLLIGRTAACLLSRGLNSMLLWLLSANPARQFYEILGAQYLRDRLIEISGAVMQDSAYGWLDIHRPIYIQ